MGILDSFKLDNKVALVTGGSDGIGKDLALSLAEAGAKVCINGRSETKLEHAQKDFKEKGFDVFTSAFDVSNADAVNESIDTIRKEVGPIDILINNAGIIKRTPILEMEEADFKEYLW